MDDKTDMIWSMFVKYKSELARKVDALIDAIETRGKTVKYIRLDNAGEQGLGAAMREEEEEH